MSPLCHRREHTVLHSYNFCGGDKSQTWMKTVIVVFFMSLLGRNQQTSNVGRPMRVPQLSTMISFNSTLSIIIQWIRVMNVMCQSKKITVLILISLSCVMVRVVVYRERNGEKRGVCVKIISFMADFSLSLTRA